VSPNRPSTAAIRNERFMVCSCGTVGTRRADAGGPRRARVSICKAATLHESAVSDPSKAVFTTEAQRTQSRPEPRRQRVSSVSLHTVFRLPLCSLCLCGEDSFSFSAVLARRVAQLGPQPLEHPRLRHPH